LAKNPTLDSCASKGDNFNSFSLHKNFESLKGVNFYVTANGSIKAPKAQSPK
jgi:hypothetical protein